MALLKSKSQHIFYVVISKRIERSILRDLMTHFCYNNHLFLRFQKKGGSYIFFYLGRRTRERFIRAISFLIFPVKL